MTMDTVDTVVIGAGVVGLACAHSLARAGREVIVIERETAFGTVISARNSEVIHAGLYYPPGSLKTRLCVAGRDLLYAWCAAHGVNHARCGKLVVASTAAQMPALQAIAERARANGVDDLRLVDAAELAALEPALAAHGALLSPSTGIVDSHGLMLSLLGEAERHGAMLALGSPVLEGRAEADGIVLRIGGEVAGEFLQRIVAILGACRVRGAPPAKLVDRFVQRLGLHARSRQSVGKPMPAGPRRGSEPAGLPRAGERAGGLPGRLGRCGHRAHPFHPFES